MDKRAIILYCKELGCCDACCIRYLGHRNPAAFENTHEFLKKLLGPEEDQSPDLKPVERSSTNVTTKLSETDTDNGENKKENCESECNIETNNDTVAKGEEYGGRDDATTPKHTKTDVNVEENAGNGVQVEKIGAEESEIVENDSDATPAKRARKSEVCVSCMGMLQEESWPVAEQHALHEMEAKGYECTEFACALSAPISTALREKAVSLRVKARFPQHEAAVTPLKEAWKWAFCAGRLAARLGLRLESGATAALLLAFTMEYDQDEHELSLLSRATGSRRARNRRELDACLASLREVTFPLDAPARPATCAAVRATHEPIYIGGRYIKLSRSLPQTPWVVHGSRVMPSSVQEVLFAPIAALFGVASDAVDRRLKLVAAGREDVDVRCLGDGRPFAVEISDPRFTPTEEQLSSLCAQISASVEVKVKVLRNVSRDQLAQLKAGEESKVKSYEALCLKLRHTEEDIEAGATATCPVSVCARDVARISALAAPGRALLLSQRTPLRVLHRRPLHARARRLLDVRATPVPGHPALVAVRLVAEAGTYVKEWVHGELGRTTPALRDHVPLDILALDVRAVHLDWPPPPPPPPPPTT